MRTNDTPILDLMKDIDKGNIQLPDFQRGWVWDDSRIHGLIRDLFLWVSARAALG